MLAYDLLHPFFGFVQIEIEQLVRRHPEKGRDGGDEGHIGQGDAVLPLGNGLKGNAEVAREHLLGNVFLLTQGLDLLSDL